MSKRWFGAGLMLLQALAVAPAGAGPLVTLPQGRIEGESRDGIAMFKAIPYAAPPLRALRWRAPLPPRGWAGVRKATAFGPVCPQAPVTWAGHDLDRTSEDCLLLNVWTPRLNPGARLPVMVWFHGGAYTAGAGSQSTYEGSSLARRGAVIVTVNYRLGLLGYLAHPALSRESPLRTSGNYGLLDQIAALRWVRANVARFGGDPANVTIFGQSAGGGSAMLLTVSPPARGLFAKAIFESGAALALPGASGAKPTLAAAERAGLLFARSHHAPTPAALRALPLTVLTAPDAPRLLTAPIVDGRVVPADITAIYRAGKDAGVPILLGWNSDEAARFVSHASAADLAGELRQTLGYRASAAARLYPAHGDADATRATQDFVSDSDFGWRSWSIAEARAGRGAPVFLYQFDNPPPAPAGERTIGAVHSDELGYVWGNNDPDGRWPARDRTLEGQMQTYWINFARTGDPNGQGLPAWPAYQRGGAALWFTPAGLRQAPPPAVVRLQALDALAGH